MPTIKPLRLPPTTVPTPIFTAFEQYSSSDTTNYNGVTVEHKRRAAYGLSFKPVIPGATPMTTSPTAASRRLRITPLSRSDR